MLTTQTAVELLQKELPYLKAEFGVRRIGLFGSFASGTPGGSSDVDLVVEFERPIGFRFIELVDYLEALLGRKVDVLTPAGIQNIRLERVARMIARGILYV